MIDLTRIRSIKALEVIKKDLTDFLADPDILKVYLEELDWGEEDYDADKEQVVYLLEKVERRIKSLKGLEAREGSPHCTKSETEATPPAQ